MIAPHHHTHFVGHGTQEELLLKAFHSGRMEGGWLLTGVSGIGKATFAYRVARFLLAQPCDGGLVQATTMTLPGDHPIIHQVTAGSNGDLFVLKSENKSNTISVESVRDLQHFLAKTSLAGGWRVVIVDGPETLTRQAINALLKRLEEPPLKTIFLLTSSASLSLLPTLRSRCREVRFQPLARWDVEMIGHHNGVTFDGDVLDVAKGQVGTAFDALHAGGAIFLGHARECVMRGLDGKLQDHDFVFLKKAADNDAHGMLFKRIFQDILHKKSLGEGGHVWAEASAAVHDLFCASERTYLDSFAVLLASFEVARQDS